jgi:hypothetical protein
MEWTTTSNTLPTQVVCIGLPSHGSANPTVAPTHLCTFYFSHQRWHGGLLESHQESPTDTNSHKRSFMTVCWCFLSSQEQSQCETMRDKHVCLLQNTPWNETCASKNRNSGSENTSPSSVSQSCSLSLWNNKESREAHLQQDLRWLMTMISADRPVMPVPREALIYVGCFGFLILHIFGLENARNLLAEWAYPILLSNQAPSCWSMFLK